MSLLSRDQLVLTCKVRLYKKAVRWYELHSRCLLIGYDASRLDEKNEYCSLFAVVESTPNRSRITIKYALYTKYVTVV